MLPKAVASLAAVFTCQPKRKPGLSITNAAGVTTHMPNMAPGEAEKHMRDAGLGGILDGDPRNMDPINLMQGMMNFEQRAGITRTTMPVDFQDAMLGDEDDHDDEPEQGGPKPF